MAVFVDDATIAATVGRHTSRWSHLTADTLKELHAFATGPLGLRREWFQPGTPLANPGSYSAQGWHYDLTEGKRAQAIRLGAVPCSTRELAAIIMMRAPATLARRRERARLEDADKVCDWPPPGCGEPLWFLPTEAGRAQVVNRNGSDHHASCDAWLAQEVRKRAARLATEAGARAARPTLF